MKIIVDAMGGDYAPRVVIEGAIAAVREYDAEVGLVGDEAKIKTLLAKNKYTGDKISIHAATETIEMSESAAASIRRKRNSSIVVGLNMVKESHGDAFFSAGNTGAAVSGAVLTLGLLPQVERPGIAIVVPTLKGAAMIIDVGANIDPKPVHLLHYGIMASVYANNILNISNPRVGLLNVGEEESKGTGVLKEAYELLSQGKINFIGNVEGKDIFSGNCDITVCDGFVGNVVLKVAEGLGETLQKLLKRHLLGNLMGKIGLLFLIPGLKRFKNDLDYAEYGGAPLLGVNGVVIIGHGRSNAKAVKNAIRVAKEEVERGFNEKVVEALTK